MYPCDILNHYVDHNAIRLLYLQNLRDETITAELRTMQTFLDESNLADVRNDCVHHERSVYTMLEVLNSVHISLQEKVRTMKWSHKEQ